MTIAFQSAEDRQPLDSGGDNARENISADSADSFKDWLDKFWSSQDILFDYKVDLTRISNKSLPEMDE